MNADDSRERGGDTSEARNLAAGHGPLTTVGNYGTPQEAAIVQGILKDYGIPAFVQGTTMATMAYIVGTALGGVMLQVPETSAEEARRILAEELPTDAVPAWECPKCGADVDAGFEVCWQCSSPCPSDARDAGVTESRNEYPGDDIVDRAFKSAIFGAFLFSICLLAPFVFSSIPFWICTLYLLFSFPFTAYALYLLGDARNSVRSERSRGRLILAHVVAYASIVVLPALVFYIASRFLPLP